MTVTALGQKAMFAGVGSMQRRRLGDTSLETSILGFGASPLGDVFARTDPSEGTRAVHCAIDRGINFFDVSPYYGLTLAEQRLGIALEGRRHQVVLATKVGRYGTDLFDFSRTGVRKSIEGSLQRLRTDYVDLLQAHDVEFGCIEQIIEETVPAMRELQEEGKARYIGITGYPLRPLARIATAVPVDTVLSYCRYNLLFTDMDEVLMSLVAGGRVGLINASPMAMGLLTSRGAPAWHPAQPVVREAACHIQEICRAHGVDIATVALQFCLQHPDASSTLAGMSTVAEVEANLDAAAIPMDAGLVREIREFVQSQKLRPWPSGRLENQEPED
jgi:L-galactose dehydrogenase